MAHHGGPLVELADHLGGVVGNLLQGLPCEDLGVGAGFLDGFRIVRPGGRYTRVAVLLEQTDPVVPAARQQPEPMDEHDRRLAARVGLIDLALLALGDLGHGGASFPGRRVAPPDESTPVNTDHNRSDHAYRGGPSCSRSGWRPLTDPTSDRAGSRYKFGRRTGSRKPAGPAIDTPPSERSPASCRSSPASPR